MSKSECPFCGIYLTKERALALVQGSIVCQESEREEWERRTKAIAEIMVRLHCLRLPHSVWHCIYLYSGSGACHCSMCEQQDAIVRGVKARVQMECLLLHCL